MATSPLIRIQFSRTTPETEDKKTKTYWLSRWSGAARIMPPEKKNEPHMVEVHLEFIIPEEHPDPSPRTLQGFAHKLLDLVNPKKPKACYHIKDKAAFDIDKMDWNTEGYTTPLESLKYPDWWNHLQEHEREALLQFTHLQKRSSPTISLGTILILKGWITPEDTGKIRDVYQRNQLANEWTSFEHWRRSKNNHLNSWAKTDLSRILFDTESAEEAVTELTEKQTPENQRALENILGQIALQMTSGLIKATEQETIIRMIHERIQPKQKGGAKIIYLSWFQHHKIKPNIGNLLHAHDKPGIFELPLQRAALEWTAGIIGIQDLISGHHNSTVKTILSLGIPEAWFENAEALSRAAEILQASRNAFYDIFGKIMENPESIRIVCEHQTKLGERVRNAVASKI